MVNATLKKYAEMENDTELSKDQKLLAIPVSYPHLDVYKRQALWVVNFFYKGIKSGMYTRLHVLYE